jgi:glycosyltransferase involved in cell wall biosynthesis
LQADIVHGFLFSAEIASRLAGRLARTPLVIGSERNANRILRKRHILAYKLTQGWADAVVANSMAGAEWNHRVFNRPASDYRVVHNGVDTERFHPDDAPALRQELGIPARCPLAGVFANFKRQKNHAMLFRAFRKVLDSLPDARLLLVGDQPTDSRGRWNDYQAQLDRLIDELGIRHQCLFFGHKENIEQIYPACDITVLPSLHEGTPNVLLESMACGVPVIATKVCDNEYIVRDGEVGYLVGVGDETRMADRMKSLLGDPALRQEMGRRARQWVLTEFSTERLAEKMGAVYLELLNRKEQAPSPC